jgi:voltage-gated potassium channel Kch
MTQPPRVGLGARLRYRFDAALSRGPSVVIGWLGLLTLAIIVVAALVLTLFGVGGVNGEGEELGFFEAMWQSMLRVVDAGSFAGDTGWGTRILALLVTLAGIFLAGSLIGLIASAVDQRIELLRKGRSTVIEHDHTLILGWSPRVPAVVSELAIANQSRKHAAVVILGDEDKTVMEDTIRDTVAELHSTTVVCRSGDPSVPRNLEMVNHAGCRSVLVFQADDGDARTVKTLLALRSLDPDLTVAPVVAEVDGVGTARSLRALFGDRLVTINSDQVIAELTAQSCRQRGLSQVFRELLDFDGDEIYFAPFPELTGRTYAECQLAFDHASVMGRLRADGVVELNPAPDVVLGPGDEIIAVAPDDSEFVCTGVRTVALDGITVVPAGERRHRRMIVVGWSTLGPRVIRELDEFLGPETTIEILVDPSRVDPDEVRSSDAVRGVRNVRIEVGEHDGGPEEVALHAARIAFNEVIVLGYRDTMSAEEADAATLLTLLAFRQVRQHEDVGPVRMVAELLEQRHSVLAAATGADDFIVSDELTSLMIAQLAERHDLDRVFADLFDREGCTIELVPGPQVGALGAGTWAHVVAAASRLGHSALGYRRADTGEVVVNPPKSDSLHLAPTDEVLLLKSS